MLFFAVPLKSKSTTTSLSVTASILAITSILSLSVILLLETVTDTFVCENTATENNNVKLKRIFFIFNLF